MKYHRLYAVAAMAASLSLALAAQPDELCDAAIEIEGTALSQGNDFFQTTLTGQSTVGASFYPSRPETCRPFPSLREIVDYYDFLDESMFDDPLLDGAFYTPFEDPSPSVFYKVEISCDTRLTLSTCDQADFDTMIALFQSNCDAANCVAHNDDNPIEACQDNTSLLIYDTQTPDHDVYYVMVHGFEGDFGNFDLTLTAERVNSGNCHGDPHFLRWGQNKRDSFHGECDLVFLRTDRLPSGGEALDVHLRTTMVETYSYVESAAIRIGNDVLEVEHEALFLNGVEYSYDDLPLWMGSGEYQVVNVVPDTGNQKRRETRVMLDADSYVAFRSSKSKRFMTVSASGASSVFGASQGLLGDFNTGSMTGRHGQEFDDYIRFGLEWQVNPSEDPILFAHAREPQFPNEQCRMPDMSAIKRHRRALRATDSKLLQEANQACQGSRDFDLCVEDVVSTGELELAEDFF